MSLTKDDLKKIDSLIANRVGKVEVSLDARFDDNLKKVKNIVDASAEVTHARVDKLREDMNRRFDKNERDNENQFKIINTKLDQSKRTEHEDITSVYEDIDTIKARLKKVGA